MDITAFLLGLLRRLLRLHEVVTGLLTVLTSRATGDVGSQRAQVGIAAIVMVERDTRWSSTHRPFIGTHRASEGRWTPTQDSLSLRLRECGRAQWGHCGTA